MSKATAPTQAPPPPADEPIPAQVSPATPPDIITARGPAADIPRKHTTAQAPEVDTMPAPPATPPTYPPHHHGRTMSTGQAALILSPSPRKYTLPPPPDVLTTTTPGRHSPTAPRQGAIISPASTPPETCKGPGGEQGHHARASTTTPRRGTYPAASEPCHASGHHHRKGKGPRRRHTAAQAPEVDTITHRAYLPHLRTCSPLPPRVRHHPRHHLQPRKATAPRK